MTRATQHCTTQPWGEARPECEGAGPTGPASGHNAPPASSPARNQPEAARVLLSSGCGANALNSTRSSALHVAVQRGFLEVVKVLCERGCDVNLPVSAGSPGSGPGVKEVVAETSLRSDHWPTTGRMPMLTHPCTAPSQRALVPAALWRSSPRCQASMSLPPTARASPCCTTRPSKATHCEFGVTHSSCCTTGPRGRPRPQRHLPAPTELSGGFWRGPGSWWTPRRRMGSRHCTWPPSTTTGRWPKFLSERCGQSPLGRGLGCQGPPGSLG